VAKENPSDPGLQIRARLMKATSLLLNDAETADKLTEQALMRLDGMEQFMSPEAALLVAKQLQMLGQAEAGTSMLKSCAEIYGDDPAVMKDIAKLTDDPTILSSSNAAADLNRQGVRVYKTGNLVEARGVPQGAGDATEEHQYRAEHGPGAAAWHRYQCAVGGAGRMSGLPENGRPDARHRCALCALSEAEKQGVWRMNDNQQAWISPR
jgi:hypothetical protein